MCRSLLFLLALTLPAFGEEPLDGAEFEAFATGKTLSYAVGGIVYGAEQYLPGRRVIWAFRASRPVNFISGRMKSMNATTMGWP